MAGARPPRLRLFDILDPISQIEVVLANASFEGFRGDFMKYRVVERCLEIISEASRHIGDDLKLREPGIPWKAIADFGNLMRHGYESVDLQVIWNVAVYDLPPLKDAASRLYADTKQPADPWPDAESK